MDYLCHFEEESFGDTVIVFFISSVYGNERFARG